MSDRERWIVYPLLLFAIGLSLGPRSGPKLFQAPAIQADELAVHGETRSRTVISDDVDARQIHCDESFTNGVAQARAIDGHLVTTHFLTVSDSKGKAVELGRPTSKNENEKIPDAGILVIYGPRQKPIVILGPDKDGGGAIQLCDADGKPRFELPPVGFKLLPERPSHSPAVVPNHSAPANSGPQ